MKQFGCGGHRVVHEPPHDADRIGVEKLVGLGSIENRRGLIKQAEFQSGDGWHPAECEVRGDERVVVADHRKVLEKLQECRIGAQVGAAQDVCIRHRKPPLAADQAVEDSLPQIRVVAAHSWFVAWRRNSKPCEGGIRMKTFIDNAGRTWTVAVNVDAIKRVRDLVQVNLLEVIEGKLLERLISDPILLCDVIYCLCKPEADAKSVSDEDFGRAMAGDAIDGGDHGAAGGTGRFFPAGPAASAEQGPGQAQETGDGGAARRWRRGWTAPNWRDGCGKRALSSLSGSVPASSASTPDDSPSGS